MGVGSVGLVCGDGGLGMDCVGVGEDGRQVASIWASGGGLEDETGTIDDVEASHGRY